MAPLRARIRSLYPAGYGTTRTAVIQLNNSNNRMAPNLLTVLVREANPLKRVSTYLGDYYAEISPSNRANLITTRRLAYGLFAFQMVRHTVLYVFGSQFSTLTRTLMLDWVLLYDSPPVTNLIVLTLQVQALYLFRLLYGNCRTDFVWLPYRVLMLDPTLHESREFLFRYHKPGLSSRQKIRNSAQAILSYQQWSLIFDDLLLAMSEVSLIGLWFQRSEVFFGSLNGLLLVLVTQAITILNAFNTLLIARCILMMILLALTVTRIVFLQLSQIARLFTTCTGRLCERERFHRFASFHRQVLRSVLSLNRTLGPFLTAVILMNSPQSAAMLASLLLVPPSLSSVGFRTSLFIGLVVQFSAIFGLHLLAGKYPARIHRPARYLFRLACRALDHSWSTGQRIRLSDYIWWLHSCRTQYGITYRAMGLVTMSAFLKYLVFYYKCFTLSYKIIKKI